MGANHPGISIRGPDFSDLLARPSEQRCDLFLEFLKATLEHSVFRHPNTSSHKVHLGMID